MSQLEGVVFARSFLVVPLKIFAVLGLTNVLLFSHFPCHFFNNVLHYVLGTTQLFCCIIAHFLGEEYYTLKFIKADIFYFDLQIVLSNITVVFVKTLSIFL